MTSYKTDLFNWDVAKLENTQLSTNRHCEIALKTVFHDKIVSTGFVL